MGLRGRVQFGTPSEGKKFVRRNEVFFRFWPRLKALLDKAVVREFESDKREDRVVYGLGRVAAEDFMELLLLAANGYGQGAIKILRSGYELTVTCGYLSRHPELVETFLEFHHVSVRKGLNHFRGIGVDPNTFLPAERIAAIEAEFARVRPQFTDVVCEECGEEGEKRVRPSWSKLDMASMTREIGIGNAYPMMYFWPTMLIHATTFRLLSRFTETAEGVEFQSGPQPREADAALAGGVLMLAMIVDVQDRHFGLGLGPELEALLTEYTGALQATGPFPVVGA